MSYVTPRAHAGNQDAQVKDFFSSYASALGGTAEITAQCNNIVSNLQQRGIFDLGGLFNLRKMQFTHILRIAPAGFPAAPDDWADAIENLAQFNFKVIL